MVLCVRYADNAARFPRGWVCPEGGEAATVGDVVAALLRDDPWQMVSPPGELHVDDVGDLLQVDPAALLRDVLPERLGAGGGAADVVDVQVVRRNVGTVCGRGVTLLQHDPDCNGDYPRTELLLLEPVVLEVTAAGLAALQLSLSLPTAHPHAAGAATPIRRRGMARISSQSAEWSDRELSGAHDDEDGFAALEREFSSTSFRSGEGLGAAAPATNANAMGLRVYSARFECYVRAPPGAVALHGEDAVRVALEMHPVRMNAGTGTPLPKPERLVPCLRSNTLPQDLGPIGEPEIAVRELISVRAAPAEPGYECDPKDEPLYAAIAQLHPRRKPVSAKELKSAVRRGVPKGCVAPLLRHWLLGHPLGGAADAAAHASADAQRALSLTTFRNDFRKAYGWDPDAVGAGFAPLAWGFGGDVGEWEKKNPFCLAASELREVRVLLGMLAHRHGATATHLSYPVFPGLLSFLRSHLPLEEVYCCGNALLSSVSVSAHAQLSKSGKAPSRAAAVAAGLEVLAEADVGGDAEEGLERESSAASSPLIEDDTGIWHWFVDDSDAAIAARLDALGKAKAGCAQQGRALLRWCQTAFIEVLPKAAVERLLLLYFSEGVKAFVRVGLTILKEVKVPPRGCLWAEAVEKVFKDASKLSLQRKEVFGKALGKKHAGRAGSHVVDMSGYVMARPKVLDASAIVRDAMQWERVYSWIPLRFLENKALRRIYSKDPDGISCTTLDAATAAHEAWESPALVLVHAASAAGTEEEDVVAGYFLTKGLWFANWTGREAKSDMACFGFTLSPRTGCCFAPDTTHDCIFTSSRLALGVQGAHAWMDFDRGGIDRGRSYPKPADGASDACHPTLGGGSFIALKVEVYVLE